MSDRNDTLHQWIAEDFSLIRKALEARGEHRAASDPSVVARLVHATHLCRLATNLDIFDKDIGPLEELDPEEATRQ